MSQLVQFRQGELPSQQREQVGFNFPSTVAGALLPLQEYFLTFPAGVPTLNTGTTAAPVLVPALAQGIATNANAAAHLTSLRLKLTWRSERSADGAQVGTVVLEWVAVTDGTAGGYEIYITDAFSRLGQSVLGAPVSGVIGASTSPFCRCTVTGQTAHDGMNAAIVAGDIGTLAQPVVAAPATANAFTVPYTGAAGTEGPIPKGIGADLQIAFTPTAVAQQLVASTAVLAVFSLPPL